MTKDEFIDGYIERSKISPWHRTPDGFKIGSHERIAVPCDCGDETCQGWQMVAAPPQRDSAHPASDPAS